MAQIVPVQCFLARTVLGWSARKLANVAGVSAHTVANFERGEPVLRVGGDENPRIDGVKRYGDEVSTALGSVLFAGKEKRGGMCEAVLRLLGIPSLRRPPGRKEITSGWCAEYCQN
jgi:transcriptional regulator with XRE-family HTH domain